MLINGFESVVVYLMQLPSTPSSPSVDGVLLSNSIRIGNDMPLVELGWDGN
jgi:hypothetical protein